MISSNVTLSGSPVLAHDSMDDLFEEIDRYRVLVLVLVIDLLDGVNEYQGDNTDAVEPTNINVEGPSSTIGLDEPIVATIHSWNTKELKSRMTN